MARNMHKYEELTPYEFDREKEKASIIHVAAGPVEYHEELRKCYKDPHFTEEYTTGVGFYPGVFFSREACRGLYMELLEILAVELEFKLCVFVGSHGPAGNMIKDIVAEETPGDHKDFKGENERVAGVLKENWAEGVKRPTKYEYQQFTPKFAKKLHDVTVKLFAENVLRNTKSFCSKSWKLL